ncbi:TPA: hypothetical protein EYP13_04665 [Candidatus Micrarchaeota archaeon]|nr:hypothetical protein [Candidatus Micrarchaeota archaeon]
MEEELGRLKDALRRLQMGIYYLNTYLRESFEIKSTLESLEQAFRDYSQLVDGKPELDSVAEEYVREQDLLPVFKEMKARYDAIAGLMKKYDSLIEEIDSSLERYRSYRYYLFPEDDSVARFVDAIFSSRGEVTVKPLIVSEDNIAEEMEKLGGKKISRLAYRFPGDRASDVADVFLRKFSSAGFVIEDSEMKITWKPEVNVVRVDAPKERIFEIDELARRAGATVLSV